MSKSTTMRTQPEENSMTKQGLMVFYVDTGDLPTHKAMEFTNRIKEEIKNTSAKDDGWGLNFYYDCLFIPRNNDGVGTEIEVFPYK